MATTFNIHDAKTQLSKLIARAEAGEEIIIARGGTPVAKLSALLPPAPEFGYERGRIHIGEGFDDPLPDDVLTFFEGKQ